MAKPFFSRFKSIVRDSRDQDPGGRYFSILLEEVYNEAPDLMWRALFPDVRSGFAGSWACTEYEYAPARVADLAIFGPSDELLALVEVKEKDQNGPGGPAQLKDYLAFCASEGVLFSYVTKRSPSVECLDVLQARKRAIIYYSDLHGALSARGSSVPLVRLFCDYLKEERLAYQPLDEDNFKSLRLLLLRSNNMSNRGHGKMKVAARTSAAAAVLDLVVANAEVLGSSFYMRYREGFGQKFVPVFSFWPQIDFVKLAKRNANDGTNTYIDGDLVLSGHLIVYSEGRLKKGSGDKSCYVWVGFRFDLDKAGTLKSSYFAGVGTIANCFEGTVPIGQTKIDQVAASRALARLVSKQSKLALAGNHYAGHAGIKRLEAQLNAS